MDFLRKNAFFVTIGIAALIVMAVLFFQKNSTPAAATATVTDTTKMPTPVASPTPSPTASPSIASTETSAPEPQASAGTEALSGLSDEEAERITNWNLRAGEILLSAAKVRKLLADEELAYERIKLEKMQVEKQKSDLFKGTPAVDPAATMLERIRQLEERLERQTSTPPLHSVQSDPCSGLSPRARHDCTVVIRNQRMHGR